MSPVYISKFIIDAEAFRLMCDADEDESEPSKASNFSFTVSEANDCELPENVVLGPCVYGHAVGVDDNGRKVFIPLAAKNRRA